MENFLLAKNYNHKWLEDVLQVHSEPNKYQTASVAISFTANIFIKGLEKELTVMEKVSITDSGGEVE